MAAPHRIALVCAPDRPTGVLHWQARCRDCPWRGDMFPAGYGPGPLTLARIDGRAHTAAPQGASGVDAALAEWTRR